MTTIGPAEHNAWQVTPELVDLGREASSRQLIELRAKPVDLRIDLASSALVVIDMQNFFCAVKDGDETEDKPSRRPIEPLQHLIPVLRTAGVPVVWVNWGNRPDEANLPPGVRYPFHRAGSEQAAPFLTEGSTDAAIINELPALPGDYHVNKYRLSGFWDTPLDSILRGLRRNTLFFAGVNLDQCVYHTLADAHFLGYDTLLLEDCCATGSPEFCTQATLYNIRRCFGFTLQSSDLAAASNSLRL